MRSRRCSTNRVIYGGRRDGIASIVPGPTIFMGVVIRRAMVEKGTTASCALMLPLALSGTAFGSNP